jgi:hypothetical protein
MDESLVVRNRTQLVTAAIFLGFATLMLVCIWLTRSLVWKIAFCAGAALLLTFALRAAQARITIADGVLTSLSDQGTKRLNISEIQRFSYHGFRANLTNLNSMGLGAELGDGSWVKLQNYPPVRPQAKDDALRTLNQYLDSRKGRPPS